MLESKTKSALTAAFSLDNDVAVITGGGTGLGFAIASAFVKAGARVVLIGRREEILKRAVKRLGPAATYEVYDVTAFDTVGELIDKVESRIGPLSILVNNAGVHLKKEVQETSPQEFDAVLQTNVLGAFALSRAAATSMTRRTGGSILFTASLTSVIGMPKVVAYAAAKSACVGMVRSLACELSPHGIRVNGIIPGWIDTSMLKQALDGDIERRNKILSRTPMARFGEPEDIGWAAVYLCSAAARFVTGILLPVDGGASIGF